MLWSEKPCNMNCWNGGFEFQDAIRSPQVEFFVTNHQWLENDSLFCDLVLPVTTCLEDDDTMGASMTVGMRYAGYTPHACDRVGESKSDWEIALEVLDRFGMREKLDYGMSTQQWLEYGFNTSQLPTEVDWDTLVEKGLYYPKLEENWRDELPGMRGFYEDPEKYPLDTPSGKLEFYSQALADHFPDDKERQPMAKWIVGGPAEEGWTHDESLWGERCKKYPLLVTANPARFRVHVQGDDIAWYREIETTKVKGPDGYLYEPLWISPEDADARELPRRRHRQALQRPRHRPHGCPHLRARHARLGRRREGLARRPDRTAHRPRRRHQPDQPRRDRLQELQGVRGHRVPGRGGKAQPRGIRRLEERIPRSIRTRLRSGRGHYARRLGCRGIRERLRYHERLSDSCR